MASSRPPAGMADALARRAGPVRPIPCGGSCPRVPSLGGGGGSQVGVPEAELVAACQGPGLAEEAAARLSGEVLPGLAARPGAARECAAQLERLALHADRRVSRLALAVMVSSSPEGSGAGALAALLQHLNRPESPAARAGLRKLAALFYRLQWQGAPPEGLAAVLEEVVAGCGRMESLARSKAKGRKSMFGKKERRDRPGVLHHTLLAAVRACQAADVGACQDVSYLVHLQSPEPGAATHALALAEADARRRPEVVADVLLPVLEALVAAPGAFVDRDSALKAAGLDVSNSWVRLHLVKACGVLACALPPGGGKDDTRQLLPEFLACVGMHDSNVTVALEALSGLLVGRQLGLQSPDHIAAASMRAFEYLLRTNAGDVRFRAGWKSESGGIDAAAPAVTMPGGGVAEAAKDGGRAGSAPGSPHGGGGSESHSDAVHRNRSLLETAVARILGQLLPRSTQPVTITALGVLGNILACLAIARLGGGSESSLLRVAQFEAEVSAVVQQVRGALDGLGSVGNPFLDLAVLKCRVWLLDSELQAFSLDSSPAIEESLGRPGEMETFSRVSCVQLLDALEYRAGLLPHHARGAYDSALAVMAACPTLDHADRVLMVLQRALQGPSGVKRAALASAVATGHAPLDPERFPPTRRSEVAQAWLAFERRLLAFVAENVNFALEQYAWEEEEGLGGEESGGCAEGGAGPDLSFPSTRHCVQAASARDPDLLAAIGLLTHAGQVGETLLRAQAARGLATVAVRSPEPYRLAC